METAVQNNITINAFREAFDSTSRTLAQVKAFQEFCRLGLPTNKSEEYRFTPIGKFLEANFDLSLYGQASEMQSEFTHDDSQIVLTILNGKLFLDESQLISSGINISVCDSGALANNADQFVSLNHAFNEKEIHIQIPANKVLEKIIVINHKLDSEIEQVMVNTRIVLDMEENSSCTIIESFESTGINPVFTNMVSEYRLQTNAYLNYYRLQNDAGSYQVNNSMVRQLGKSTVNSFVFSFDGSVVRNNSIFSIEAEHCESNFYGLYLPSGKSLIDNHTVADHRRPNCASNELYKGIISDSAKGVFNGKIFVRPDAQKTNAFQSNRNILLSDTAFINTKPQLEIWADDVKCSHGCTTGQLDDEALFYLQSRGISQEDAKVLLLTAFASEVLGKIQDSKFKEEMEYLVGEKLQYGE
jgi:Fe-S cluster assembly protein SufD